ncbi:MAG: zinc ribbon domain-containing protein [Promethearchaeota archaeon]
MAEIKDYVWIFPFIGSILTAIGLFTPSAVYPMGLAAELYWMHGFYLIVGGGTPIPGFVFDIPGLIIIGIICIIPLIVCTIIMFISSLTHRGRDTPGSWLALSILFIAVTIFFIGGSELAFRINRIIHFGVDASFWLPRLPSFAVIAPFIAGGLGIIGFIIGRSTEKEKVEITPISEKPPPIEQEIPPPVSGPIEGYRFCPDCGQEITSPDIKFCPNCGFEFKKT